MCVSNGFKKTIRSYLLVKSYQSFLSVVSYFVIFCFTLIFLRYKINNVVKIKVTQIFISSGPKTSPPKTPCMYVQYIDYPRRKYQWKDFYS